MFEQSKSVEIDRAGGAERFKRGRIAAAAFLAATALSSPCVAADLSAALSQFQAGDYEACLAATESGVDDAYRREDWAVLRLKTLMTLGKYADAVAALETALERSPSSIRLRWVGREVYRFGGDSEAGDALIAEMSQLIASQSWRYRVGGADLVTVGRYRLATGADPKDVLDREWTSAQRSSSGRVPALLACGELALSKDDFALAQEFFEKAVLYASGEPDAHVGLARSLRNSDAATASQALQTALELNPNHIDAILFQIDGAIDQESYDEARSLIESLLKINPKQPDALAYLAVMETVLGRQAEADAAYALALSTWAENPAVPHAVGRKLSQKYRFVEGARFQRIALKLDPGYLRAKSQLSSDLLRLGEEQEGWEVARDVADDDPYNVQAYNLTTLESRLNDYVVLESGPFRVRMERTEAKVYGDRVLSLLTEAAATLPLKYETTLPAQVSVDIYAKQADFAIRTFGLPGGSGFLGVCFGPVVTMNSPASLRANRTSWESVLWHEFTHVVTLTRTRNRMPRWLSEGISVYEEMLRDPRWGQSMSPTYHNMIMGDDLTPVSQLSGAFLSASSPVELQFAYYESSLVVRFLVTEFGTDALNGVLADLAEGYLINDALSRHALPIADLDVAFATYARELASAYAPELDFTPEPGERRAGRFGPRIRSADRDRGPEEGSTNRWSVLRSRISAAASERRFRDAYDQLGSLMACFDAEDVPVELLREKALLERRLSQSEEYLETNRAIVASTADGYSELRVLIDDAKARDDSALASQYAEDMLAIDPLVAFPHEVIAEGAKAAEQPNREYRALRSLIALDRADLAGRQHRLAELSLQQKRIDDARQHVLLALEEAPRYVDAYRLLQEIRMAAEEPAIGPDSDRRAPSIGSSADRETETGETGTGETDEAAKEERDARKAR